MSTLLDELWSLAEQAGMLAAPQAFMSGGQRLYWPYLVVSVLIALTVLVWQRRQENSWGVQGWLAAFRDFFSVRIWWHPSARLDYQLFVINPILVMLLTAGGLSVVPVIIAVSDSLYQGFGAVRPDWPAGMVTAVLTLSLFVADDLTRFLLHRWMHRSRLLWSLHRLHHSAEVLTPFTVYRMHPLESALYALRMVITQGAVVGVFFYAFGMRLTAWEVAGANLLTYIFNMLGSNLRHSPVWLGYPVWLERWLISPAQHQIHHSADPAQYDQNFGAFLAVWDRLGGSLRYSRHEKVTAYGVPGQPPERTLKEAYLGPVQDMVQVFARRLSIYANKNKNDLH